RFCFSLRHAKNKSGDESPHSIKKHTTFPIGQCPCVQEFPRIIDQSPRRRAMVSRDHGQELKQMATHQLKQVIQSLREVTLPDDEAGLTDGQLLERYLGDRQETAFTALVGRHGPMVWGVCRRLLGNHHDAEDAFQATFLVLVRKAAAVVPREMVANWLHGVAQRTALKARAMAARRSAREQQVIAMPELAPDSPDLWDDLQPRLDQELGRLPDKYRAIIVLCD